jgi:hypothetical protein
MATRRFGPFRLLTLGVVVLGGPGLLLVLGCGAHTATTALDTAPARFEPPPGPPFFQDVTDASGIEFLYQNGEEHKNLAILESLGGGVALLDFDGDGLLDIFFPGGGTYDGTTIKGHPCKLYRNLGGCKFKDVSKEVGLDGPWFYSHGAAVCDYDRDGWPDLLVTGWGRLALWHNEPVDPRDPAKGRKFVEISQKAGLTAQSWSSSAAFADLDGDGWPDLYIAYYADWSFDNHPQCTYDGKTPDVCPPKRFKGLKHKVFLNNRDGTFKDVTEEAGIVEGGESRSKGLGVLIVDVNGDGKPDIYVANDTVDNFLYINRSTPGKIRLEERGLPSGTARDDRGAPNGSMGVDAGDYDRCGRPTIWVTNYENELHALYHNDCLPARGGAPERIFFSYRTVTTGIAAIGQTFVGWGTGFVDIEHRGWEDLFVVNGHAIHHPTGKGVTRKQRPVLLRNQGDSSFADYSKRGGSWFESQHLSRGLALGDLDNDGKVDAVIANMNEPAAVLRNVAPTEGRHWLGVELKGKDHREVVGARIILEAGGVKQYRFAKGGGSYASSPDRRHVFGLDKTDKIDRITVEWPGGKVQQWTDLAVDKYHKLVEE